MQTRIPKGMETGVRIAWLAAFVVGLAASAPAQTWSNVTLYPVSPTGTDPWGITVGPDGAAWFTAYASNQIGRINGAGIVTEYALPGYTQPFASEPYGIASGPDGALWFTELQGNQIGRITTSGVVTQYPVPTFASEPEGITAGPNSALWFTEWNGNNIGCITTSGVITEYPVPTVNGGPVGIAAGSNGALWFTEFNGNKIGSITTGGVITEYPVPTANSYPAGITAGPDGALWFTEYYGNKIGRITTSGVITEYPVPTAYGYPWGITAGPDGALWFAESGGNKFGRITTSGLITEYPVPGQGPDFITAGPTDLSFTEWEAGEIGRAPACGLGFSASFASHTLTLNFQLGTSTPATWYGTLTTSTGKVTQLWSKAIPVTVPPASLTLTFGPSFPNLGEVTIVAGLETNMGVGLCYETAIVNTTP
jgi:virginiamycin B lyase